MLVLTATGIRLPSHKFSSYLRSRLRSHFHWSSLLIQSGLSGMLVVALLKCL